MLLMTTTKVFEHLNDIKYNDSSGVEGVSNQAFQGNVPVIICKSITFYTINVPSKTIFELLKCNPIINLAQWVMVSRVTKDTSHYYRRYKNP